MEFLGPPPHVSQHSAWRKFGDILMQNPLEIVVFQWKIAQERVRNAKKNRLRRETTQKRHLDV